MDATCTIQDSIHVFSLVHKYVSRILGTYQSISACTVVFICIKIYGNKYKKTGVQPKMFTILPIVMPGERV